MSKGLKDTGSSKEKREKLGKEGITRKDFYNGLNEAISSRNREEAENTEKLFKAMSGIKTSPIVKQEETENRLQKELSEEIKTTTKEETKGINIVPICKKDKTNNLPRESTNNIRNDKKYKLTSEYNSENNKSERSEKTNGSEKSGSKESSLISNGKKDLSKERNIQEITTKKEKTKEKKEETKERCPYGYIYLIINTKNGKVYVGQTIRGRWRENQVPIEERWKKHIQEAKLNKRKKEANLDQKIYGSIYLNNAINKYGFEIFKLKQIDTALNQRDLDKKETLYIKEFDSMNPSKGYNMTEGGHGGRQSPEVYEKISKTMEKKWQDQQYREDQCNKISEGMFKMWKNPKLREERIESLNTPEVKKILREITTKRWEDPQQRKQLIEAISKGSKKMWENPEIQKKQKKGLERKWRDPNYRKNFAKDISNVEEFLDDIEHLKRRETTDKYDMSRKTINRNIKVIFGPDGPSNFWEAKRYLQNKDLEYRREKRYIYMKKVNKNEFLLDIRDLPTRKEMIQKYGMSGPSITYRIKKIFGPKGPKNFTEAKIYLQGKNMGDILEITEKI